MQSTDQGMPEWELSDKRTGAVRYLEHGCPHWRIRWHCHDEYELHLIVATTGKVFVGDYVGNFRPGHLILTGPRLPHNWISQERHVLRDRVVHFDHDVITGVAKLMPELKELTPLLERAKYGIEFFQLGRVAERYMELIKTSSGAARLGHFYQLMSALTNHQGYRILSAAQIELPVDEGLQEKINRIVNYAMDNHQNRIALGEVAALVGMNESYFSRFFHKATGNRFGDFINRIRISKACELLTYTDKHIATICYEVGFNNIANFNRRFLEHKRITPGKYRKQARQRTTRSADTDGFPA